ncbi:pantothenate synthetase [Tenuifilaceae bacterium CYCD]|nr:pantothenate synthetase [Tenuifilaceae bacterium CYCD]
MIKTLSTIEQTNQTLNGLRGNGKTIGFVPTMGALHEGHASLVKKAVEENDFVVVSIFVNPTQFNDKNDLRNYPRTPEKDIALLNNLGVHYVFMPTESEIYPVPDTRQFDFGLLDKVMEGEHRPGHFNGVAQIVSKLFEIVKPHRAYFGQKDFQQLAIIRKLVKMLNFNIEIVACPILREKDGLAMSSRNLLLDPEKRASAPLISKTLFDARNKMLEMSVKNLIDWVVNSINGDSHLSVEYFELSNAITLEPIKDWNDAEHIVGCIAVSAGNVRLIDNVIFK